MTSQLNGCPHFLFNFYSFLTCKLCVINMRKNNDSNVHVVITQLIWTTWTSMSDVWKRLLNLIALSLIVLLPVNSSPPGQNGRHFADTIFSCTFVNEKCSILIKISLTFVPKCPIDNNPALVQIMAWRWIGDKPLSKPMLTWFTDAYMQH